MAPRKSGKKAPTPGQIHTPIEIDSDDEDSAPHSTVHRHNTRTAKNGRAADTYEKYDMRYHPADDTLRPAQAAKRHASHPFSRAKSTSTMTDEDKDETDEESLPSSAEDDTSDEGAEEDSGDEIIPIKRKADPKASCSSKRSEAQKYHNYSKKHHKDDDRIPGFEHKNGQVKRVATIDLTEEDAPKRRRLGKLRKQQPQLVTPRSQDSVGVDDLVEEALLTLEKIAPSTARISTKHDDRVEAMSSSGEDDEPVTPLETAHFEAEEDPLPLFTNIEDKAEEDESQSEPSMQPKIADETSDGIDEALLRFTEVPTSDGNGPADVATSDEATSGEQDLNDVIEAIQGVSDASHADSSHTLQDFVNSEEEYQAQATSSTSPEQISKAAEDVADEKVETNHASDSTEMSREDPQNIGRRGLQYMQSGLDHTEDASDEKTNAVTSNGNIPQPAYGEINTQNADRSTGRSKTSESSKTFAGEYAVEANGATEGHGLSSTEHVPSFSAMNGVHQPQEPEPISAFGSGGPSEELIEAAATTLQAMLEKDIATSQQVVAASSSSDMLM